MSSNIWTEEDWKAFDDAMEEESVLYKEYLDRYVKYVKVGDYNHIEWDHQLTGIFPNVSRCMNASPDKEKTKKFLLKIAGYTLGCCTFNERNYARVETEIEAWESK